MDEAVMNAITASFQAACDADGAALALSKLCTELGMRTAPESARFLAAHALGLAPDHAQALALLEQTTPADDQLSLCIYYERFLASAPRHGGATEVRARLVGLLFQSRLHYSALHHIDDALAELCEDGPSEAAIERAQAPFAAQPDLDLARQLEELEFDLLACEELTIADAAE